MFEKAARMKLRFHWHGAVSVEDLWDLPLTALDTIFKSLSRQMREQEEESLLETRDEEAEVLSLQIGIVKHVVATRLVEREERERTAERAKKKQRLLGILADKQDEGLREMSVEELQQMIEEL